jgi:KUP system potassium uptake protein
VVAVLALVLVFESSSRLAAAYGVAVTGTIIITAFLYFTLVHIDGRRPLALVVLGGAFFLLVDLVLLAANLIKIVDGGYIPLAIGAATVLVMLTWKRGRQLAGQARGDLEGRLDDFVAHIKEQPVAVRRVPGTAVFLSRGDGATPLAMRQNVERNHVLHRRAVILTVRTPAVARVAPKDRLQVRDLGEPGDGVDEVVASFGYTERMDLPAVLLRAQERGKEKGHHIDLDEVTYFVSSLELNPTKAPGMARWRKRLFVGIGAIGADPVDAFHLPRGRTITMGADIDI